MLGESCHVRRRLRPFFKIYCIFVLYITGYSFFAVVYADYSALLLSDFDCQPFQCCCRNSVMSSAGHTPLAHLPPPPTFVRQETMGSLDVLKETRVMSYQYNEGFFSKKEIQPGDLVIRFHCAASSCHPRHVVVTPFHSRVCFLMCSRRMHIWIPFPSNQNMFPVQM